MRKNLVLAAAIAGAMGGDFISKLPGGSEEFRVVNRPQISYNIAQ